MATEKKFKVFEGTNLKKFESDINTFSEKHSGMVGQSYPILTDAEGGVTFYGFYWYGEKTEATPEAKAAEPVDSRPEPKPGEEFEIDFEDWKFFPDNGKFWTKDPKTLVEQSIGKKQDGQMFYLWKSSTKKVWGDVVMLGEKKAKVKIRV